MGIDLKTERIKVNSPSICPFLSEIDGKDLCYVSQCECEYEEDEIPTSCPMWNVRFDVRLATSVLEGKKCTK